MPLERKLVLSKAFEKSYQKFTNKNQTLKTSINKALLKLQQDVYDPSLRTHKLSGKLAAYLACSCGYDCRIVFIIEKDIADPALENILLLDIGPMMTFIS
jgi:mRNA interferase YafQ